MAIQIFPQNTIALIWDFDETLIPGSMQKPIFEEYEVDEPWEEVNNLGGYYAAKNITISQSSAYLNHMLTYVRDGSFRGLNNAKLEELGRQIEFFDGVLELCQKLKTEILGRDEFQKHDINIELYVVSAGLKRMIKGSHIAPYVDDIWGCEFIEDVAPPGYLHGRSVKSDSSLTTRPKRERFSRLIKASINTPTWTSTRRFFLNIDACLSRT